MGFTNDHLYVAAIAQYLRKQISQPFLELGHPEDLDKFLKDNSDRATVVGFFASKALAKFPLFVDAGIYILRHAFCSTLSHWRT